MPQIQFKLVEDDEERDLGSVFVNDVRLAEAAKKVGIAKPQNYTIKKGKAEKANWFNHIGHMDQVYYLSLKTAADSSFSSSRAGHNLTFGSDSGHFFDRAIGTSSPCHFSPAERAQLLSNACQSPSLFSHTQTAPSDDKCNLKMRLEQEIDKSGKMIELLYSLPICSPSLLKSRFEVEKVNTSCEQLKSMVKTFNAAPISAPNFSDEICQTPDIIIKEQDQSGPFNVFGILDKDSQKSSEQELQLDVTQSSFYDEDLYSEMPPLELPFGLSFELPLDVTQSSSQDDDSQSPLKLSLNAARKSVHVEDLRSKIPLDITQKSVRIEEPKSRAVSQPIQKNSSKGWLETLKEFTIFKILARPMSMIM